MFYMTIESSAIIQLYINFDRSCLMIYLDGYFFVDPKLKKRQQLYLSP